MFHQASEMFQFEQSVSANFSATPRGLAAMSDGAGMSGISAAGKKKKKKIKGLFLQGSFQQVLQQPAQSVSQCTTSYAAKFSATFFFCSWKLFFGFSL